MRVKKRSGTRVKEYDVIVACADYVLINETKSTLQSQHVDEMITALGEFREFFPEYQNRQLIGIVASLYVDESVVHYASTKGILVMGMGRGRWRCSTGKRLRLIEEMKIKYFQDTDTLYIEFRSVEVRVARRLFPSRNY